MITTQPRRTIAVTARARSRFSRLRVRYPDRAPHPRYDAALARELLADTGEIPDTKRGLVAVLTEYRTALHDLTAMPGQIGQTSVIPRSDHTPAGQQ